MNTKEMITFDDFFVLRVPKGGEGKDESDGADEDSAKLSSEKNPQNMKT